MSTHDETAIQALSTAGAFCGECGFEPGDRGCPDCEDCWASYVKGIRAAGWAPRDEVIADRDAQIVAWLLKKAAEEGTRNKDSRVRATAIYRMADKLSRGAVRPPLSKGPAPKPDADFTLTLDPHAGVVSVTNISDAVRNKLRAEGLDEAADIADQMQGSRHIVQELRLRAREVADQ